MSISRRNAEEGERRVVPCLLSCYHTSHSHLHYPRCPHCCHCYYCCYCCCYLQIVQNTVRFVVVCRGWSAKEKLHSCQARAGLQHKQSSRHDSVTQRWLFVDHTSSSSSPLHRTQPPFQKQKMQTLWILLQRQFEVLFSFWKILGNFWQQNGVEKVVIDGLIRRKMSSVSEKGGEEGEEGKRGERKTGERGGEERERERREEIEQPNN